MKSLIISLFLLFCFLPSINILPVSAEETSTARAMCVMEVDSGRVLYSKNMDEKLAMASTTKIMTAITVIENCDNLDERFIVDSRSIGVPGTSIYLTREEEISCRELLYGLMLASGNDASVALACRIGETYEVFIDMMNSLAKKIGATNSHFVNPHGLDAEGHFTTAHDLAKIAGYAMKNETFKEIVKTKSVKIEGSNEDGDTRYLNNKNRLLATLDGCVGVKTGYTSKAGRCYVGALEKDEMTVVCVVLNCGPMFEESAKLMEQAHDEFKKNEIFSDFKFVRNVSVEGGEKEFVKVYLRHGFLYPLKDGELLSLHFIYNIPYVIEAPVENDEEVGNIEVYLGNDLLFSEKIYTMEEVKGSSVFEKVKEIVGEF